LNFSDFGLILGVGGFVNWEPMVIYPYTQPKTEKSPPSY
jgi:hypothetical protein